MSGLSEWMTAKETAAYLRTSEISLRTAHRKRKKYMPTRYKFGRRTLYKRSEVEAAIRPVDNGI